MEEEKNRERIGIIPAALIIVLLAILAVAAVAFIRGTAPRQSNDIQAESNVTTMQTYFMSFANHCKGACLDANLTFNQVDGQLDSTGHDFKYLNCTCKQGNETVWMNITLPNPEQV